MDEDYDACDLENWFLAIQSADGQVMIPSFHRPAIIRYDPDNPTTSTTGRGLELRRHPTGPQLWADSASRILRPVAADGHDAATFPDLVPDPTTGKITYDVDNDGDGVTDSVWLDLGYPGPPRRQRHALQAAVRLHGHRPERPHPAQHRRQPRRHGRRRRSTPGRLRRRRSDHARTWATRSARSTRPTPSRTPSTPATDRRSGRPPSIRSPHGRRHLPQSGTVPDYHTAVPNNTPGR